jgi:hydrophobic/amphiphilic exporter-1 (mainly G- bacteria), HAE1 family
MVLSTFIGILFIPVTFSFVEYVSHRFRPGGKGTTMDSDHDIDPKALGRRAAAAAGDTHTYSAPHTDDGGSH